MMKIAYYLNEERKKNLYCRISDGTERVTFSLDYAVDPKEWNAKKEEVSDKNEYHYTLIDFKRYLTKKYHEFQIEGKDKILERLKNEALSFTKESGLEGIAGNMFDYFNEESKLPKYKEFIQAFEKFGKLKKGEYKVETVGELIHFHTKNEIYEMHTYAGQTSLLKSYIEKKSYDEIVSMTDEYIWNEIYLDPGIVKSKFMPEMLREWEIYWAEEYRDVREKSGKIDHLNELKQQSWRQFQVFMECYNDSPNIIELASKIDESCLYPISVITMLNIFDAETCYSEYCEHEFFIENEWETVSVNDDDSSPVFFIRKCEF
ncbi:MAG: hypothetical protein LBO74_04050 [Candidatus Symbiothrix sp.]|nr:hypothetical protein [Candidatus Symbiothrix sp.]